MTFGPLRIAYADDTLRPRPWTEQQSAWARELLAAAPAGPVLELCSGVGHIGLLAILGTGRRLVCVDSSPSACDYARRNASAAGLGEVVEVRTGAMEEVVAPHERYALVIADPPWVPSDRTDHYAEDPVDSIDGGADGLDIARTCVRLADRHLLEGGQVLLQLGDSGQVDALAQELADLDVREVREGEGGVLALLGRRA